MDTLDLPWEGAAFKCLCVEAGLTSYDVQRLLHSQGFVYTDQAIRRWWIPGSTGPKHPAAVAVLAEELARALETKPLVVTAVLRGDVS